MKGQKNDAPYIYRRGEMKYKVPVLIRDVHERNERIDVRETPEDTVVPRFEARSKGRFKWATMMESMQMMEKWFRVGK